MNSNGGETPWPEYPHLTVAAIEEARQRLEVPEDWVPRLCANECGGVVFIPPTVVDVPNALAVCSAQCAAEISFGRP